jgi:hypothetical protein
MLSLESGELRNQARQLKSRRLLPEDGQSDPRSAANDFIRFGGGLAID